MKPIFHYPLLIYFLIFTKALFTSSAKVFPLQTTENNEVSSANSFVFDKSSARSFMYIRNRNWPNVEPSGTYALTSAKEEDCPLSTTLCFLFLKKLNNKFNILSDVPFCFSLKIMPSIHFIKYSKNYNTFHNLRILYLRMLYILYTKKNKTL